MEICRHPRSYSQHAATNISQRLEPILNHVAEHLHQLRFIAQNVGQAWIKLLDNLDPLGCGFRSRSKTSAKILWTFATAGKSRGWRKLQQLLKEGTQTINLAQHDSGIGKRGRIVVDFPLEELRCAANTG